MMHQFVYHPKQRVLFFCQVHEVDGRKSWTPLFWTTPQDWLFVMTIMAYFALGMENPAEAIAETIGAWHEVAETVTEAEEAMDGEGGLDAARAILDGAKLTYVGMPGPDIEGWSDEDKSALSKLIKDFE